MPKTLQEQNVERDQLIRASVATLKNIADATEGSLTPTQVAERVIVRGIALGMTHHDTSIKKASGTDLEAVSLAAHAEKHLGEGWVDFEPETLLEKGYTHRDVTMMMAAKYVLYHSGAFTDWHEFEKVALALNGDEPQFDITQHLTVAQCAWAADVMRLVDPHTPFSYEVAAYIAARAHEEGFTLLPDAVQFADGSLKRLTSDLGLKVGLAREQGFRGPAVLNQEAMLGEVNQYVNARHQKLLGELQAVAR